VINFSPDSQTGSVEIPLERLGRRSAHADAADDLFMLRDRLSKKVYFKTRKQLGHLFENLNPFERRIYFIRQIHNPGATLRNLVNNVDMQGGFRAEAEYRAPTFQARHEPHPSSLPWSAPSAHALPTAA